MLSFIVRIIQNIVAKKVIFRTNILKNESLFIDENLKFILALLRFL